MSAFEKFYKLYALFKIIIMFIAVPCRRILTQSVQFASDNVLESIRKVFSVNQFSTQIGQFVLKVGFISKFMLMVFD